VKLYVAFETRQLARNFERYLKPGSGHAFAIYIQGGIHHGLGQM